MSQEIWRQNAYNTFWHLIHNIHTRFHIPHWIFSHNPHWFSISLSSESKAVEGRSLKAAVAYLPSKGIVISGSSKTIKTFVQFHLQWLLCLTEVTLYCTHPTKYSTATQHNHALLLRGGHFFLNKGQRLSMSIIFVFNFANLPFKRRGCIFFQCPKQDHRHIHMRFSN